MRGRRETWTTAWSSDTLEFHQSLHAIPVTGIRRQQLQHSLVVTDFTGEPPTQILGDVEVAN